VLPFIVIGDGARESAIGRALVESTITKLSAVRDCSVHPGGGIVRHAEDDPLALGRAMHVDFVLDGSVRCEAAIGRVSVRLFSVTDGAAVWADMLEERCDGAFAFDDAVSDELAGALAMILTNAERKLLVRRYTESGQAYQNVPRRTISLGAAVAGRVVPRHRLLSTRHRHRSFVRARVFRPSIDCMPRAKAAAIHALDIEATTRSYSAPWVIHARGAGSMTEWNERRRPCTDSIPTSRQAREPLFDSVRTTAEAPFDSCTAPVIHGNSVS
jgi:TolB-like protein